MAQRPAASAGVEPSQDDRVDLRDRRALRWAGRSAPDLAGSRAPDADLRRCAALGSAALDLAYVAAGRYDGFWERRLNAWDMAAGLVILREAGGLVEPIDPEGDILSGGDVIGANEAIFDSFAKIIRD